MSYEASLREHYGSVRGRLWASSAAPVVRRERRPQRRVLFLAAIQEVPHCPVNLLALPSWRLIVKLVALRTGVSVDEILGTDRSKAIVAARHEAVSLVKAHTRYTLPQVGRLFNMDHTSVLYALRGPRVRRGKAEIIVGDRPIGLAAVGTGGEHAQDNGRGRVASKTPAVAIEQCRLAGRPSRVNTSVRSAQ